MLTAVDICVDVTDKRILWNISTGVKRGEILAIMGPSGSGKTTLLNAIAGYIPISKGNVFVDGVDLSVDSTARNTMSYVMQNELFFEDLTLRETLVYSTLLRLPYKISFKKKLQKVDEIIESLGLVDCQNTIVGGPQRRGLSGGEKKRLSIACELALQANVFLLDEPTSGLDSTAAFSLFTTLKKLAHEEGKTIITSIHQPSSQLFYSFDRLLLIAKGKVGYFGPAASVMEYFATVGLHCSYQVNPGDFAMDMLSAADSRGVLIGPDPPTTAEEAQCSHLLCHLWPCRKICRLLLCRPKSRHSGSSQMQEEEDNERALLRDRDDSQSAVSRQEIHLQAKNIQQRSGRDGEHDSVSTTPSAHQDTAAPGGAERTTADVDMPSVPGDEISAEGQQDVNGKQLRNKKLRKQKWTPEKKSVKETLWVLQFIVLLHRTFKRSRRRLLTKISLFQTFCFLLVTSIVWFQVPYVEESIRDRTALLFYMQGSWAFQILGLTVASFPLDSQVVAKEKAAKYYGLSAYFLSKVIIEKSFIFLLSSLLYVPLFFLTGLRGVGAFFGTWLTVILHSLTVQSIGYLFGAIFMDTAYALAFAFTAYIPAFVLGGFLVSRIPTVLSWLEYISPLRYAYNAAIYFNFISPDITFACARTLSHYASCVVEGANSTRIAGVEVMQTLGITQSVWLDLGVLCLFLVAFSTATYLALRFLRGLKPPQ